MDTMKEWPGFALAWLLVKFIGMLPRRWRAECVGDSARSSGDPAAFAQDRMFNLRLHSRTGLMRAERNVASMTRYLAWQAVNLRASRKKRANIEPII